MRFANNNANLVVTWYKVVNGDKARLAVDAKAHCVHAKMRQASRYKELEEELRPSSHQSTGSEEVTI
jgi:hypothetical protein